MSDNDGESDTESYFLTPVNEYNIVDKIQSANSLLFASIEQDDAMELRAKNTENTSNKSDKLLLQSKHRVTFSSDIEEYDDDEVDSSETQYKDDEAIDKEIAEIIERDEETVEPKSGDKDNIDGFLKRLSIEEVYSNDDETPSDNDDYTTEFEVIDDEPIDEHEKTANIFEESTQSSNVISVPIEDTKPMLNKLQTDEQKSPIIIDSKVNATNKSNRMSGNDSACNACNRVNSTPSGRYNVKSAGLKRPATAQIHRASSANSTNFHRNLINKELIKHDELLKIHLNVRACCENKYLDNNRLPRYNGYISQYGLSKDQLEMREMNRQKFIEKKARREREIMRAKQQIADLNEQAFQLWLVRKNRLAKPKFKNMYDSTPPRTQIKYHPTAKFPRSKESHS